jgi:diguanylate cyclase (GGDEF)-like protein
MSTPRQTSARDPYHLERSQSATERQFSGETHQELPSLTPALAAERVLDACGRLAFLVDVRGSLLWMSASAGRFLGLDPALAPSFPLPSLFTDMEDLHAAFAHAIREPVEDVRLSLRDMRGGSASFMWAIAPVTYPDTQEPVLALVGVPDTPSDGAHLPRLLTALRDSLDLTDPAVDPPLLYARLADLALEVIEGGALAWLVVREEDEDVTITVDALGGSEPRRHAVRTPRAPEAGASALVGEPVAAKVLSYDPRLPEPLRLWASERALTRLLAVPVRTPLRQLGTVGLAVRDDATFDEDDLQRLRNLADLLAWYIERAHLLRARAEHEARVVALRDAGRRLTAAQTSAELADVALETVPAIAGCSRAVLFLRAYDSDEFRFAGALSPSHPVLAAGLSMARADVPSLLETFEQTCAPLVIDDARRSPLLPGPITQILGIHSTVVAPLMRRQEVVGLLLADEPYRSQIFSPPIVSLLGSLAAQTGVAFENVNLRERVHTLARALDTRTAEVEALHRMNTATHGTLELEQVLRNAVEEGQRLAGVQRCAISLAEGDAVTLRAVTRGAMSAVDHPGHVFALSEFGRLRQALTTQKIVEIQDVRTEPLSDEERAWMDAVGVRSALVVPMVSHGRSIGTIAFSSVGEVKIFSQREKELCTMLANDLASAIENARLYEAERRQHLFAEKVSTISRTVSSTLSLGRVLRSVVNAVVEILVADRCGIFLLDEEEQVMRPEYLLGLSDKLRAEAMALRLGVDEPLVRQIMTEALPIRISDPETDPRTEKSRVTLFGVKSLILLPLVARERVIGLLFADRAAGLTDVSDRDVQLALAICDQAALAAQNARIYAETEARVRDLEVLYDISYRLGSLQRQEDVMEYVLLKVRDLLPCRAVQLFLVNDGTQQLELKATRTAPGVDGEIVDAHPAVVEDMRACWALNQNGTFAVQDAERDFRCSADAEKDRAPARAYACIPIVAAGVSMGVLRIVAAEPRVFSKEHLRLIQAIAGQLGAAMHRVRLIRELEARTVRDPLTQVSNHTHFLEKLRAEVTRSLRQRTPVTVLYVDVDNFKGFNDRFGHPLGDTLLITLTQILRECVRASDEVGRVGGDEFAIMLPNTDAAGGEVLAEKLRSRIAQTRFAGDLTEPAAHLTVSVGVASFPAHGASAEQVVRSADQALYRAKAAGRNRTVQSGTVASS